MKPSAREFFRQSKRLGRYGLTEWIHGYVYARWIYLYIGIGTGEHAVCRYLKPVGSAIIWMFQKITGLKGGKSGGTFAHSYHGKVLPLEGARNLVTVDRPVHLPNLEKVIPYSRARDIILENPEHIAVMTCPCRSVRKTPCLPLDVCLIIGEPFVRFVLEHHPGKARRIGQEEAVRIIEEENRRGHVTHAFFKDAMLDRFYAICNCCSCCCGAMQAHRNGTPMLASSGYVCRVDTEACIGCGTCVSLCQFGALKLEDTIRVDRNGCMGCGVCVNGCPESALELVLAPEKGTPLEIHRLMDMCSQ